MKKTAKKKAWEWFSRYFRLKNSDEYGFCTCYTCGKRDAWNHGMQTGHLLDGRCNSILFIENCVRVQCTGCNMFKSGLKEVYIPKFIDEQGREIYDDLVKLKNTTVKYSKKDYEILTKTYKDKARQEASRRGIEI